ncbi:hypothetical protein JOM56_011094 [Amanita muscaria]
MSSTDYTPHSYSEPTDAHLHPIQRLCPEVLAEIFTFCLPDVPKDLRQVEHISSRKAPLLLCSVCSSWRSLAISTPRLWQTFHFRIVDTMDRSLRLRRPMTIDIDSITSGIRTWLDRSGALPFFWIRDRGKAAQRRLILEVLLQEVSRWGSFEICENGISVTPPHFGILPMLHTLGSSIDGVPFTAAPCLKRLCLSSLPNPTSLSAIPWDRLVELTIIQKPQTISMVVEVIQCCPRLESLSLPVKEGDKDDSLTLRSIIQHDTLRREKYIPMVTSTLLIFLTYPDDDGDVLLCPQLRHLTLNACYCSDKSFPGLLGRMILSRCLGRAQDTQLKLRSLQLENTYSLSKEDYELLQFAQSNCGLELGYSHINNMERVDK